MLHITRLIFNGSIWLRISGDIHLLPPYAFMAQKRTSIFNRILLVTVTRCVANYWVGINGSIWLRISGDIQLLPPYAFMA
jgi:hypothetical protein